MKSVRDLEDSAPGWLNTYCDKASRYAWPNYDLDLNPKELTSLDLLAPAYLSYPIRRDYFEPMLQVETEANSYHKLYCALEDVIEKTEINGPSFDSLSSESLLEPMHNDWGLVLKAFEASDSCKGLTSVAVSKILHRKRPNLVPLIDSRVRRFYGVRKNKNTELFARIHSDLNSNIVLVDDLRKNFLLPDGQPMSRLRALDIVIWMSFE